MVRWGSYGKAQSVLEICMLVTLSGDVMREALALALSLIHSSLNVGNCLAPTCLEVIWWIWESVTVRYYS